MFCMEKVKIWSYLNGKNNKVNLLGMDRHTKESTVNFSFDLPLAGQRSSCENHIMSAMD